MKIKTIIIILGSVLVGALLFYGYSKSAEAATLTQQQLVSDTGGSFAGGIASALQGIGTGYTGTISAISVYLEWDGAGTQPATSTSASFQLRLGHCSNTAMSTSCASDADAPELTITTGKNLYTFTFSSPVSMDSSKYYYIGTNYTSVGSQVKFYGSANNTFQGDTNNSEKCWTTTFCTGLKDIYFYITGTPGDAISITYPTDGSTGLTNFGLWKVNYSLANTVGSSFINIFVNTTSTVSQSNYSWYDQEPENKTAGAYSTVLNRLHNDSYASGTTYYAKAYLYKAETVGATILASSAVVSFDIGDPTTEQTFESLPDLPFILPTGGGNVYPACTKFPFSYWCDFVNLWAGLTATSTTDTVPTLSITLPSMTGGASTTVSVISASNINTQIGSGTVSLMRSLIQYGLWIAFGFYVYERIKNLKF